MYWCYLAELSDRSICNNLFLRGNSMIIFDSVPEGVSSNPT